MKKRIPIFLFVCFWIASGHSTVCDCDDNYSFEEQFAKSEKVFSGTVIEIVAAKEEFWPPWMKNTFTRVTIQVDRYWKGEIREEETIEWHSYCRWYLKEGEEVLFFVDSGFPHDRAGCGLSDRVDKSREVIEKLGPGETNFSRDLTICYVCVLLSALVVLSGVILIKVRKLQICQ
jgi:hypothetical protein